MEESVQVTRQVLAEEMRNYVQIILSEYGDTISQERRAFLEGIRDYMEIVVVEEIGTISMFATDQNIIMPLGAYSVFEVLRTRPEYGSNKEHRCYEEGQILNKTDYFGYIKHVILAGMSVEDFFRDTLLHETMHFCGAGGYNAIREGFTELKTRELAQKYGLTASRCGYFKEVEIASRLQNIIGKDVADRITFAENDREIAKILVNECGIDIAKIFFRISSIMEKEHHSKYDHSQFGGSDGPLKKAKAYAQIDYSEIDKILKQLENPIIENDMDKTPNEL